MTAILIVEDEPDLQHLLKIFLSKAGYDIHLASDGAQGLQSLQKSRPDLIVTDIMMPNMDGLEMIREIRKNIPKEELPIIVSSAVAPDAATQALTDGYLRKPIMMGQLKALVEKVLRSQAGS
ncbi:response regulator [Oligoflexus tunisiensis]|uniref:response regulator n=1 Tax=Oligoflexus tunisiensis TaxID=708132 RepID=UPI00114D1AB6|nr:response regulator [Oligoflexus tunisiensis]